MKKILLLTIIILATITMLGETKALIIGVGEYDDETIIDLPEAINDAKEFRESLLSLGICSEQNISYFENPSLGTLITGINNWAKDSSPSDTLILYYSGHGYSKDGEVYIAPSDVNSDPELIEDTAFNFKRKFREISDYIKSEKTIVIMDACYSGALVRGKPLRNVTIEKATLEAISQDKGVSFLLSSGEGEISKLDESTQKGIFTKYLVEGLHGDANKDNDDYITLGELYDYVKEQVQHETYNSQNPVFIGQRDIKVTKDIKAITAGILNKLLKYYQEDKISKEYYTLYFSVLSKTEGDTETEAKIRNYLIEFGEGKISVEILVELTKSLMDRIQGNCLLKVIAGNEITKQAIVKIDGTERGNLNNGILEVENLNVGTHNVLITSPYINDIEMIINFENKYEMIERKIEAEKAKRLIRISTRPSGAEVWIDNEKCKGTTTLQVEVEVGKDYKIRVEKEDFYPQERIITVREKGEPIFVEIEFKENQPPTKPQAIYPALYSTNISSDGIVLNWSSNDPEGYPLEYKIYFGKNSPKKLLTTTSKTEYELPKLEYGTQYKWKVEAIDEKGLKTESDIWTFTTVKNRPPNKPVLLGPPNSMSRDQAVEVEFDWRCTDPENDSIKYDFYLGRDRSSLKMITSNLSNSSYTYSSFEEAGIYYWKIIAKDSYGGKTESDTGYFGVNGPPEKPVLTYPDESNNKTHGETVTLKWVCKDPENDLLEYKVYYGKSRYYLDLEKTGIKDNSYTLIGLDENELFYWKVKAIDRVGNETESEISYFGTNAKPKVKLFSPAKTASKNYGSTVELKWRGEDPDGDSLYYTLYMGTSSYNMTEEARNITKESYTVSGLEPGKTYYWKVEVRDSDGEKAKSETGYFGINQAPNKPRLVSPANTREMDVNSDTTLKWECSDPDGDSLSYNVYIGQSQYDMKLEGTNIRNEEYQVKDLEPGETYYWKVVASDGDGGKSESDTGYFGVNSPPEKPELIYPKPYSSQKVDYKECTFKWESKDPDGDQIEYKLYYGPVNDISKEIEIEKEEYEAKNLVPGTYYEIEVVAVDSLGASSKSQTFRFKTKDNQPPEKPTNISPKDGSTDNDEESIVLQWNCEDPEGDSIEYEIYFGTSKDDMELKKENHTTNELEIKDLKMNQKYFWKIRAVDIYGNVAESEIWQFKTRMWSPLTMRLTIGGITISILLSTFALWYLGFL